jgi:hypothetical protein
MKRGSMLYQVVLVRSAGLLFRHLDSARNPS